MKLFLFSLFTILTFHGLSIELFWINGNGQFSNTNKWSLTSGGAPALITPTANDTIHFDNNSGLTALSTINVDVAIEVHSIFMNTLTNTFTLNATTTDNHSVFGSILGNPDGIIFTGIWGTIQMLSDGTQSLESDGIQWNQNFFISGDSLLINDDFHVGVRNITIDAGYVEFATGTTVTCGNFISTSTNTREIIFDISLIKVQNGIWNINGTNLTMSAEQTYIELEDAFNVAIFNGGGQVYGIVHSMTANQLNMNGNVEFGTLKLTNTTTWNMEAFTTVVFDSLDVLAYNCLAPLTIQRSTVGTNPLLIKSGYQNLNLTGVNVNNVNITITGSASIALGTVSGGTGWTSGGATLYWVGNSGDWADGNKWSTTSGGAASGCVPTLQDSVVFDANSFSLANQTVTTLDSSSAYAMTWINVTGDPTLLLDSNLVIASTITLENSMSLLRSDVAAGIIQRGSGTFYVNNATVDINLYANMLSITDVWDLNGDLLMSDSTNLLVINGGFRTNNYNLNMGSIIAVDDPDEITDERTLILGSSKVELFQSFITSGDTDFTLNAGTSHIIIADTGSFDKMLLTEGLPFHDVTVYFKKLQIPQIIGGNNTFNKLRIKAGSHIQFNAGSTQTVSDSLLILGSCLDSIHLSSTIASTASEIIKTGPANRFKIECVNFKDINASGQALTAFFSTNISNNTNITFNTANAANASFIANGPFCFGDETVFTNTSTAFSGNAADLTYQWYFNDGSFQVSGLDTLFYYTFVSGGHTFELSDSIPVILDAIYTNGCFDSDTSYVVISRPQFFTSTNTFGNNICPKHYLELNSSSGSSTLEFEYFLNGVSVQGPSVNDTLFYTTSFQHQDTIEVRAYDAGCNADTSYIFTYNVYPSPTYTFTASVPSLEICQGDPITFNGSSAQTLEYRFLVNNISVTPFQPGAGAYTNSSLTDGAEVYMIVNDQFNCKDTSSTFNITVNPLPTTALAQSISGNVICSGDEIIFTASGANAYEFFVDATSVQGPLASNTFTTSTLNQNEVVSVIGYSAAGCVFTAPQQFSYFVTPTPVTTLFVPGGTTACLGEAVTFTGQGANVYEFFVNGTSTQGPATQTNFITTGLSDNDVVYVIGSALGCASTSAPTQMTITPAPVTVLANNIGVQSICNGTSVEFTASGAAEYEFLLNGGSLGAPSPVDTYTTTTLTNNDIISVVGYIGSCSTASQQQFTVFPNPIVDLFSNSATNILCDGDPITFNGSGGVNYTFFVNGSLVQGPGPGSSLVNPTLNFGTNQVYVEGTSSNGCSTNSALINVVYNPNPVINVNSSVPTNEICAGDNVIFTANGGDNYQFLINGAPQTALAPNATFSTTSLQNGNIVSVMGSLNGCVSTSNTIPITVNPIPSISVANSLGANQYCEDILVTYTASGASNYQFLINGVSQGAFSPVNEIQSSSFPVGPNSLVIQGEELGCISSTNTNITIFPLPNPTLTTSTGSLTYCDNQQVTLQAGGGNEYQFFVNGVPVTVNSFLSTYSTTNLDNGDIVSVNVTNNSGCAAATALTPITIHPNPSISIIGSNGASTICNGDTILVEAAGGIMYEFFLNGVSQGTPSANNEVSFTGLVTGDQIYTIGQDANCNTQSNTLNFISFGVPNVALQNVQPGPVCDDEPISLLATGAPDFQFFINGVPTGPIGPTATFNQLVNDNDVITAIGEANGCQSAVSNPIAITVYNYPTINVNNTSTGNTICAGAPVTFTANGAMTYTFEINTNLVASNATGSFTTSDLENGDIVSIIGLNGHCAAAPINELFIVNSMGLDLGYSPSSFLCSGENMIFEASGADEYEFFVNGISVQGPNTSNIYANANLNSFDEITFTGTNNTTGCVQPYHDFVIVTVVADPTISPNGPIEFCEGDSVILSSNSSYGNQWYFNGNPIVGETSGELIVFDSGQYSLITTKGGQGEVWSIGKNSSGIHGNGNNFNNSVAVTTSTPIAFQTLASGYEFILGKTAAGTVYSWGKNSSGQLGNGTFTSAHNPLLVNALTNVEKIAATRASAMAVHATGDVYVWGENNSGQLGLGSLSIVNFPLLNPAITDVDTIAGGLEHFVILKNDGTVWTVGNNLQGQLGNNSLVNSLVPIQVAGLTNISAIGAGEYHSFAIDNNGLIYGWGNNSSGQLGLGDLTARLIPTTLPINDVVSVSGGANHTVFLKSNGTVYSSGSNTFGQLGVGSTTATTIPKKVTTSGVKQIATNQYNSIFLRNDQSVYGCGSNQEDQLSPSVAMIVTSPEVLSGFEGVTFVSSSQFSTHTIYGNEQGCNSSIVNVIVNPVPVATLTVAGDILSTIPGAGYQWYFNGLPIPNSTNQSIQATAAGDYYVVVELANGCFSISEVHTFNISSLDEEHKATISVYPNPSVSFIRVEGNLSSYTQLSVLDFTGRIILHISLNEGMDTVEINTSNLSKGGYHILLEGNDALYRTKFIKN